MKKLDQNGSHVLAIVLFVVVLAVVGFAAFKVFGKKGTNQLSVNDGSSNKGQQVPESNNTVSWEFTGSEWRAQGGTPPKCEDPVSMKMPVNVDTITHVLYPAQKRSTGYKTHGGFRFDTSTNGEVKVVVPRDSMLVKASRYYEQGEVQYFMLFVSPCGIAYRFDHLHTLSPKFQAVMDKLPEPKVDDSRTTPINPPFAVKTGDEVATKVGFVKAGNFSVDFGVYDLRQKNAVSKEAAFAAAHADDKEFAPYGICFFDVFTAQEQSKLKSLPAADAAAGKSSDYCK